MKQCRDCTWAEWERTKGGRRILTHGGKCSVPVEVPHCYEDNYRDVPERRHVSKYTIPGCPHWKKAAAECVCKSKPYHVCPVHKRAGGATKKEFI